MSIQILIVEDEPKLAQLLSEYLTQAAYSTAIISRRDEAIAAVDREQPELLLLDLNLPGLDGVSICQQLRQRAQSPAIIMVTARVDEVDRLLGLELGADDYICKPYSPREVVARVKAVLRRVQPRTDSAQLLEVGPLQLHKDAYQLKVAGLSVPVTPIEFSLLLALLERPERIWTRAQLLERGRGTQYEGYERNIDGHIKNLRRKLRQALDDQDPIRSVYGVGYGLNMEVLADTR